MVVSFNQISDYHWLRSMPLDNIFRVEQKHFIWVEGASLVAQRLKHLPAMWET